MSRAMTWTTPTDPAPTPAHRRPGLVRGLTLLSAVTLLTGLVTAPAANAAQPRTAVAAHPAVVEHPAAAPAAPSAAAAPAVQDTATPPPAAAPDPVSPGSAASFAGVTVTAPADWPVTSLDGRPGCVRYDEHAVFLGEPSDITCPARLIGRTSTVQLLRDDPAAGAATGDATPRVVLTDTGDDLVVTVGGTVRAIITVDPAAAAEALAIAASVTVDGVSAEVDQIAALAITRLVDDAAADGDAGTAAADPAAQPQGLRAAGAALVSPQSAPQSAPQVSGSQPAGASYPTLQTPTQGDGTFRGMAFDTCSAPSVEAMAAWRESSYGAVGIYIGGAMASCKPNTSRNPNLTADWVDQVARMGWKMIPIYVGIQAPGTRYSEQINTKPVKATEQGVAAAQDAVTKMAALGLGPGNPIYLDMEAWNTKDSTANAAVISFTQGWTEELHRLQYQSGFYSSAGAGINVIASRAQSNPSFLPPDAIWFARWYSQGDTSKPKKRAQLIAAAHVDAQTKLDTAGMLLDTAISDVLWTDHQRGWQYLGGHVVEHGGFSINIDSNLFDGPVAPASTEAITLATGGLPNIAYNAKYSTSITAKGQKASYRFTATDGQLPPGITLAKDGTLAGKTSRLGVWSFTVVVTDSARPWRFGAKTYQLVATFPDLSANNPFTADIAWLANGNITTGYANGTFRPRASVTRQAMAAYLYRYMHPDAPTAPACTKNVFKDVKKGQEFCGEIAWLVSTGITTGYDDGTFRPAAKISRQAMAAFLYRLQHPEEMPELLAQQREQAATAKQKADLAAELAAAADKADAAVTAAKKAVKQAEADLAAATKAKAKKQATAALAAAQQALTDAKAAARTARKAADAAAADAKVPPPNLDTCDISPMPDVPSDALFCRQIDWLVSTQITTGYATDGGYHAADAISRQAMAAFLHRLADLAGTPV